MAPLAPERVSPGGNPHRFMETPRAPTWGLFMGEKVVHESGQRRERKEKWNKKEYQFSANPSL